jgi:hypothetical protein
LTAGNPRRQDGRVAEEITTQILIQIRDEIRGTNARLGEFQAEVRGELRASNERLDHFQADVNQSFGIVRMLLQGMDARIERIETVLPSEPMTFLPRRVEVLEEKVARIEDTLDLDQD